MDLPVWMTERRDAFTPDSTVGAASASGRGYALHAVRRAAGSFAGMLQELTAGEDIAARPGLLQRINPAAKTIGLIALIVAATLVHHPVTLVLTYGLCLLLAALSAIPGRRLLRVWQVVPLFSAAVMLPALFNVVTPGRDLITIWRFAAPLRHLPATLTITDNGLLVAGRFVLRSAVCLTLALLLTLSTRTHRLFHGLRALGAPMLFVMLLSMMERYLTLFVRAAQEIHMARISRSIALAGIRREQAWVAAGMGALFRRTQALGNAVHLAMLSRGYTGEVHLLDKPRWQVADWAWLMIASGFTVIMLIAG